MPELEAGCGESQSSDTYPLSCPECCAVLRGGWKMVAAQYGGMEVVPIFIIATQDASLSSGGVEDSLVSSR